MELSFGGLATLFFGSLLASTVLPGGVEGLLYLMVKDGTHSFLSLLVTASVGNTLGGILTWWVGLLLFRGLSASKWQRKLDHWFRLEQKPMRRVRQWGAPILLLSWMPIIGDPLCLAAGYLRVNFWLSALMIAIGKTVRYIVLLLVLENSI
jgi:membrane protein YqaA with SNARE-associated domain